MQLGLNLLAHQLTGPNFAFARQAGATAIIAHLVDYDRLSPQSPAYDWRAAASARPLWTVELLGELRRTVNRADLELVAVENLDPSVWYDILLDGPRRDAQVEDVKELIRRVGAAGIPCLGYYFSLAGVWGQRWDAPVARGGAQTAAFDLAEVDQSPVPNAQVWGLAYPHADPVGAVASVDREALWGRLQHFLAEVVPVAEEAQVRLAAHPDDPPLPELRGTPRLLTSPDDLQRLIDLEPSPANALDFCQGTVTEMVGPAVVEVIGRFAAQGRIAYAHVRNVSGRVPRYHETFLDDGDVDILAALRAYRDGGFDGVIVPDHAPALTCAAPWHAGMAHALGYLRAGLQCLERGG